MLPVRSQMLRTAFCQTYLIQSRIFHGPDASLARIVLQSFTAMLPIAAQPGFRSLYMAVRLTVPTIHSFDRMAELHNANAIQTKAVAFMPKFNSKVINSWN